MKYDLFEFDVKAEISKLNLPLANPANLLITTARNNEICRISRISRVFYGDKEITIEELQEFLGDEWDEYKNDEGALKAWAALLYERKLIEQGIAPPSFTATTECANCGIVPISTELANNGQVLGCPWCLNRAKGLFIPKPPPLTTGEHKHDSK